MRPVARLLCAAFAGAAVMLACRDGTGPDHRPGIRFIAGDTATDTVNALLPQALVVEVRLADGGLAPESTAVHFETIVRPDYFVETLVGSLASPNMSTVHVGLTDAAGRAAAMVRLGVIAGPARLVVYVPELERRDTVRYTVRPGNATNLVVAPQDTALFVGGSFVPRATVSDAHGNARDDEVTWTATGALSVTAGGFLTANATGRHAITATVEGAELPTATMAISVVPDLRIAAMSAAPSWVGLVAANLDGGGIQRLVAAPMAVYFGGDPLWMAGTDTLLFASHDANGALYLRVVGQDGVARSFFDTPPSGIPQHDTPAISADGNWVFFATYGSICPQPPYCIFRTTSTRGAVEWLATGMPSALPSPSPDGGRVAFMSVTNEVRIRVFDVASGTVAAWSLEGSSPSWSPQGTKIAYVMNGRLRLVNPDGSGDEELTPSGFAFWGGPIHWSPDGKWIIARFDDRLRLLEVATGQVLPLAWTEYLTGGSLKQR